MNNNDLEFLINEALDNIRNDRKSAREFLNEIANQIAADAEQNKYLSPVAAKHIETLQRSNEHIVQEIFQHLVWPWGQWLKVLEIVFLMTL